jgi:hypothetical protein
MHVLTNPMHKTKRESTSSPNIAIQKASFWGKLFEEGVGGTFSRKSSSHKTPHKKLPRISYPVSERCVVGGLENNGKEKTGVDKWGGGVVK